MIEYLNDIDTEALLAINGLNDAFQDAFWPLLTALWASLLLLFALLWVLLRDASRRRTALLTIAMLVLVFVVADQVSATIIKPLVERLRPTQDPSLTGLVHIVNGYKGGRYGFVSSHAANSFAAVMFVSLLMRRRVVAVSLFVWAALQCYSRMYLGVHYPGDILGGTILGLLVGWLVYRLYLSLQQRLQLSPIDYTPIDARLVAGSVWVTVIALLAAACVELMCQ